MAANIDEIGAKLRNPSADFQDQALQLGVQEKCRAFQPGGGVYPPYECLQVGQDVGYRAVFSNDGEDGR